MITQLTNLRALQHQQAAGFSYKRPPRDEDEDDVTVEEVQGGRKGHLPRVKGHALLNRLPTERLEGAGPEERQASIRALLNSGVAGDSSNGASQFVDKFFSSVRLPSAPPADTLSAVIGDGDGGESYSDDEERATAPTELEFTTPEALDDVQEEELLSELRGLRKSSQR